MHTIRTDLAVEAGDFHKVPPEKMGREELEKGGIKVTRIHVTDRETAEKIGKAPGRYVTAETEQLSELQEDVVQAARTIAEEISAILPEGLVLVAGLGNMEITPDSLGPKAAQQIFATRHIQDQLNSLEGRESYRPVACMSPGVLGQTGIETGELIGSVCKSIRPAAVVAIDALASRRLNRLCRTVQITDTGISPGSGIGNRRMGLNAETLGCPVVGIGVPTVVDAATLAADVLSQTVQNEQEFEGIRSGLWKESADMIVTPKDIDAMISSSSYLVALAVNMALHKGLGDDQVTALMN